MSPDLQSKTAIGIRRHFTKDGTHPYDEVEWDRRDARIANMMDGSVAFEQKNVEFPTSWSQNATNIVAQKYFYGTPGKQSREYSLKQLIDRVADTIAKHGDKKGYFAGEAERETFRAELKHVLVTQKAAFNSPVWFNIGTPDRDQQASACFILAAEDTMDSILNWYTEEGKIFKGGSGSGINLSKLRSSYEPLRHSGGTASGPVSFMRGADASAGTIKSGGKTRRAAKMVILNVDHPDIEEFIWCKAVEERKARVLGEAGFDMDLDGKDSFSIQYQNANNSVRVTDDFMKAVEEDGDWELVGVKSGKVTKTVRARDLMRQISQASWECADPGLQYDTTINRWHTAANTDRINASNPCSEYMHLDNSACNLASINLLKFLQPGGVFDIAGFRQAAEVVFTAQEILVGYSSYPTESIGKTARAFRELGLGYANLGAMLMALGLPYDSDEGRAWAATITALMTGHAYATSARIAKRMGPFAGYAENREPMQKVLQMHRGEVSNIDASMVPEELLSAAQAAWDDAVERGRAHGVRNSQATVLAPTGTIGFMMDCDTTGIEPDLGLVKLKKLVGGGTMEIVNQTVPRALKNLGYNSQQVDEIIAYIDENKTITGAPHLKADHMPVFATSMGDNTIHYMGHVRMMGAVQPFISGAISKTVNMPEEASVEDVEELHIEGWKLGLKAIAIYRDNCKVAQPLAGAKKAEKPEDSSQESVDSGKDTADPSLQATGYGEAENFAIKGPMRRELPQKRSAKTIKFHVADCKGFLTVGEYDDGKPGEVFIQIAKQGSTLSGVMDSFAIAVSHSLQWGVPLKEMVKAFINSSFAPSGMTDDPDIPTTSSLMDYIFRRLAVEYLPKEDLLELGMASLDDLDTANQTSLLDSSQPPTEKLDVKENEMPAAQVEVDEPEDTEPTSLATAQTAAPQPPKSKKKTEDVPLCYNCGNPTQRAGSCYVCTSCGTTSGCS